MKPLVIGVDIGGTTVKIGFISPDGGIVYKWEIKTDKKEKGTFIIKDIWQSIQKEIKRLQIDIKMIRGIGVGAPGFVNECEGAVVEAFNIGWDEYFLKKELEQQSNLPVFIENDANLAGLGEYWKGAGKDVNQLLTVTIGTGIGGGIIINGDILRGANGAAGEIGHILINPKGDICSCGQIGCLETIASATGMVQQAMKHKRQSPLLESVYQAKSYIMLKDIFFLAEQGDVICKTIIEQTAKILGCTLASIAVVINPELILIGGGVSMLSDVFIANIKKSFNKNALTRIKQSCDIQVAHLGNDAGIIGAAFYALKQKPI